MYLIKWENNRVVITPEAYAIKSFRAIWNADRSNKKDKAAIALGTLFFMYDPRSDYRFETDENTRLEIIKEQTGLGKDWKPDKLFLDAVPVYIYLTNTTSAKTLDKNRKTLDKVDTYLDTVIINDDNITKIIKAISDKNDLAVAIAKAEKEIYKNVEEYTVKMRGKGTKTIGDEGLSNLFNND